MISVDVDVLSGDERFLFDCSELGILYVIKFLSLTVLVFVFKWRVKFE